MRKSIVNIISAFASVLKELLGELKSKILLTPQLPLIGAEEVTVIKFPFDDAGLALHFVAK